MKSIDPLLNRKFDRDSLSLRAFFDRRRQFLFD